MYVFYQAVKYDMATNGSDVPMFISGLQSTDQNTCITNLQRNYTTHDQAKKYDYLLRQHCAVRQKAF